MAHQPSDPNTNESPSYQQIVAKLDEFIRRYYKNQLLKGLILVLAVFLASLTLVAVLEHFGRFGTTVRTVLFYTFLLTNLAILGRYILIPGLKLFRMGSVISYEEASRIVGRHFPEVKDKLLNTLQLYRQAGQSPKPATRRLIMASIDQRCLELRPVPFKMAIRLGENKRYLKYALLPLAILLLLLVQSPGTIVESTNRIIDHRNFYEVEAPFDFRVTNDSLKTLRNEDFPVHLKMAGKELPEVVYIEYKGQQYRMDKEAANRFEFLIKNPQEKADFRFSASGFASRPYELEVLPVPLLQGFSIALDYPDYTGREDETLDNVGDLTIPAGTHAKWVLRLENTRRVKAAFHDTTYRFTARESRLSFSRQFLNSNTYFLLTANEFVDNRDSIRYRVNVVPDAYPQLQIEQEQDSASAMRRYFSGKASDDYGISQVQFVYKIKREGEKAPKTQVENLEAQGEPVQPVFHMFDLKGLGLAAGESVEYYFRAWDNDAINGRKAVRSQTFSFNAPTREALEAQSEQTRKAIKDKLEDAAQKASQLQRKMEEARRQLLEKQNYNWQDQQKVENLMQRQQQLQNQVESLKEQYRRSTQQQQRFGEMDEQSAEQHRELQEMMDEMMNPEMKEMMEKLNELMQKKQKNDARDQLEQMEQQDRNLEQHLRQMKELFKQLEVEEQLQRNIEELEKLAQKQKELAEKGQEDSKAREEEQNQESSSEDGKDQEKTGETEEQQDDNASDDGKASGDQKEAQSRPETPQKDKATSPEDQQAREKQQEALNEAFEKLREKMEKVERMNEELNSPYDMENTDPEQQDIQQDMQEGLQQMRQGQQQQSRQKQRDAAQKMQALSQKMSQMQASMKKKATQINMRTVRQLLENLIFLSQEQERLMERFREVRNYNPQYVALRKEQFKLKEDAKMVEDSLRSLANRVAMIKPFITREMDDINHFLGRSIEELDERKTSAALKNQQYVMTHVNNLGLMLSEVLDNMQQQMSSMMSGQQMTQKMQMQSQGGKRGKSGKQRQKQLEQMRKMQEKMGEKMGKLSKKAQQRAQENKEGKGGQGGKMSEEMARLAAQQEALRQRLREMQQQSDQQGQGEGGDLQKIQEQMDKNEEDFLNKEVTEETLRRQERIIEQLLDAEKAERQRETDPKRESESARDYQRKEPPSLDEYKAEKMKELEMLRTLPPALSNYYKERVMNYFDRMKK